MVDSARQPSLQEAEGSERSRPGSHDHDHDARTGSPLPGRAAALLGLQRLAGNRAVTAGLRSGLLAVQRHTPGGEEDPVRPMGEEAVQQIVSDGMSPVTPTDTEAESGPGAEEPGAGESGLEESGEEESEEVPFAEEAGPTEIGPEPEAFAPPPTSTSGAVSPPPPPKTKATTKTTTAKPKNTAPPKSKPVSSPPPKPETRAQLKAKITITIRSNGAKGEAQARKYIDKVFLSTSAANLKAMAGKTIEFNIIPAGKKLTDLTEFASLKGTKTFDGRLWDDVRGIWMGAGPKTIRFAVGEEDLGGKGSSGYGPGFVAGHEGGHGLQNHGLTDDQKKAVTKAYTDRKAAHPCTQATKEGSADEKAWLQPGWYSAANENEYFASSVAAWYGYPYNTGKEAKERYTRSWLKKEDKPMYDILCSVFGN